MKYDDCGLLNKKDPVTLRVRVWIEIKWYQLFIGKDLCHPPCEGVD